MRNLSLAPAWLVAAALLATSTAARATEIVIPHMGRLLKAGENGDVPANGTYKFRFSLHRKSVDSSGETSLIWEETYPTVNVVNGTYAVDLGVAGDGLATIDIDDLAANDALWLEITLFETATATTGIKLTPRARVAASPLAHYAHNAGKLGGKAAADYLLKADFDSFKEELTGGEGGGGLTIPWAKIVDVPDAFSDGTDDGLTSIAVAGALSGTGKADDAIKIRDASIDSTLIAADAVTSAKLLDGSVISTKLALGAVGPDQIATNAVGLGKIAPGSVGTDQLAANAVDASKLAANAVTPTQLAANAVTTAKIADASITKAKLATGAVDASVFTANSIGIDKLALSTCTAGKILKATASGWTCGDDVGGTSTPNFNVTPPLATAAGSPFTLSINAGGVGSSLLTDAAVITAKIADAAVASAKLADNAVIPAKLALDGASLARVSNNVLNVAGGNIGIGTTAASASLSFGGEATRSIGLERKASGAGSLLSLFAGAAQNAGTDLGGGELRLSSGVSTGAGASILSFYTSGGGTTGTGDRAAAERMRLDGQGDLALGLTAPVARLNVRGGGASAAITVAAGLAIPLNSVTVTGASGWTTGLTIGDLITIGGVTRQIVRITATTVDVDTPFNATAPIAAVSFTYTQGVARVEKNDGSVAFGIGANGTVQVTGMLDAPNALEIAGFNDPRVTNGLKWTGCVTCGDTTTDNAWVANAGWGVNRFTGASAYSSAEFDNERSSYLELALIGNVYKSVVLDHLDWWSSRWVDVYISFDNGGNWNFSRRINTFRQDQDAAPYVSSHYTIAANLPTGFNQNVRVRVVATKGRMHFQGFGLSRVNLPDLAGSSNHLKDACPANMLWMPSGLCVSAVQAAAGFYSGQDYCRNTFRAHVCTWTEIQQACTELTSGAVTNVGFTPGTAPIWFGDHGGADDMFGTSNSDSCGSNIDSGAASGVTGSARYRCCR